jgi:hypothetical protein
LDSWSDRLELAQNWDYYCWNCSGSGMKAEFITEIGSEIGILPKSAFPILAVLRSEILALIKLEKNQKNCWFPKFCRVSLFLWMEAWLQGKEASSWKHTRRWHGYRHVPMSWWAHDH